MATTFRPIPVLITDGGAPSTPDSFIVNYSVAQRVVAPVPFAANAAAGANYLVQSPNGFKPGDLVVAISMGGNCAPSRVTAVAGPDVNGVVTLSHTGAPVAFTSDAVLLNLGPKASGQRVAYDVSNNVLRSTALWDDTGAPGANAPNPIAPNVMNMKLVYGIDNGAGGVTWTPATGAWSPANVHAASTSTLSKIRAVRIGFVVRGEQWDKEAPDFNSSMFDGTIPVSFPAAGGNYRYRIYETLIPLRNPIWNPVS
jgi:type IV pilus assembly protein PilW